MFETIPTMFSIIFVQLVKLLANLNLSIAYKERVSVILKLVLKLILTSLVVWTEALSTA